MRNCDGFFYRGKKVVVVGGGFGNGRSHYLANLAKEVVLVHRRDYFKGLGCHGERAKANDKIKFMVPWTVTETIGDQSGFTQVKLKNTDSGKEVIDTDGLFYAIGHDPNSGMFTNYVDLDSHGFIKVMVPKNTGCLRWRYCRSDF